MPSAQRGKSRLTRYLGLGPVHSVSLAEARDRAREARQALLDGRDPIAVKHADAQARRLEQLRTITFAEACERFLATDRVEGFRNAVHRKQWRSTLAKAYPVLGDLPLQSIDSAILLQGVAADHEGHAGNRKQAERQDRAGDRVGAAPRPVHRA